MRETPGSSPESKIVSSLEAAKSIKLRVERVNRLVTEGREHFRSFALLQRKQPGPDASDAEWIEYFALLDAVADLTIDKHMSARVERREIVVEAFPHMVRDLTATLDGASMAGSRYDEVSQAFDQAIMNVSIMGYAWAVLRTTPPSDDEKPEQETEPTE